MPVSYIQLQTDSSLRPSGRRSDLAPPCRWGGGRFAIVILAATLLSISTQGAAAGPVAPEKLELKTTSFQPGGNIPRRFTCDGANASPALAWSGAPASTKSFVLIVDDPDAPSGTFVHWVAFNLPDSARQLPERVPSDAMLGGGGWQGVNDFAKTGYGGPCPPPGKPHRYFFRLYALDTNLSLKPGAHRTDVDSAMHGHVLAHAELMGLYSR
jgi:hypothetical protein